MTQKCSEVAYETIRENLAEAICPGSIITYFGLGNRVGYYVKPSKSVLYFESISLLFVYVGLIVTFTYMVYYLFDKIAEYDNAVLTPEDFAVKINGLPTEGYITVEEAKRLRSELKARIQGYGFKVEDINFTFDLEDYVNIKKQYAKSIGRDNYLKYLKKLKSQGKDIEIDEELLKEEDPIHIMMDGLVEKVLLCQE